MGLGNNVFTELKNEVITLDKKEKGNKEDENISKIDDNLKELYKNKKELEIEFTKTQLSWKKGLRNKSCP